MENFSAPPTPTPTPTTSSTNSSSSNSSSNNTSGGGSVSGAKADSSEVNKAQSILNQPAVLGTSFENPSHISDQINVSKILDNNLATKQSHSLSSTQIPGGLLLVSGGIVALASLIFISTFHSSHLPFVKPFPK